MLGISTRQRAESGISLGTLEAGKLVQRQEVVSRDGEPTPSLMEVFGTRESEGDVLSKMGQSGQKGVSDVLSKMGQSGQKGVSDVLSKMGQSAHEINDHPEVTSPHKPLKPAHAYEDNNE